MARRRAETITKQQILKKKEMNRIGLFGGTFNPIHIGHLRAAREVADEFNLSQILFIPSCLPPHKAIKDIAPPENRLEMVRRATCEHQTFEVSDVELQRAGVSYTVETVKYFNQFYQRRDSLFLIMGMDAFLEVDTWKSYTELFEQIPMIVMERPNAQDPKTPASIGMREFIRRRISDEYQFEADEQRYVHPELHPIYYFQISLLDISGTKIRGLLRNKKSITFLVPETVEHYIITRGLYL